MKTLRIGMIGLASAVGGFVLQGCFAQQPLPECTMAPAQAYYSTYPFYVELKPLDTPASCTPVDHVYLGAQRYRVPDGGGYRIGMRSSLLMDHALGYALEADVDPSNNCANEEDCDYCVIDEGDGGYVVAIDGGPVADFPITLEDGGTDVEPGLDDGMGGYTPIDLANECASVPEPVYRVDASDPDGHNLVGYAKPPMYPTAGICSLSDFSGASQVFQEETQVDGTVIPELPISLAWEKLDVMMGGEVLGSAFTGKVKITEGACTTTYEAFGYWPGIHCSAQSDFDALLATGHEDCANPDACTAEEARGIVDRDCDPFPNVAQGRAYGSGINPAFKPTCDLERAICKPTVDPATLLGN